MHFMVFFIFYKTYKKQCSFSKWIWRFWGKSYTTKHKQGGTFAVYVCWVCLFWCVSFCSVCFLLFICLFVCLFVCFGVFCVFSWVLLFGFVLVFFCLLEGGHFHKIITIYKRIKFSLMQIFDRLVFKVILNTDTLYHMIKEVIPKLYSLCTSLHKKQMYLNIANGFLWLINIVSLISRVFFIHK